MPSTVQAARPNGPDSAGNLDVPATVITARTKALTGRPTFSWAAALMAMGVFVGLVSAVIARGDTDALIDATAAFVDPSHTPAARMAVGAQPMAVMPMTMPTVAPVSPTVPPQAPIAMAPAVGAPMVGAPTVASPATQTPAQCAVDGQPKATRVESLPRAEARIAAAPQRRPAPHHAAPAPRPAPKAEPKAIAAADKADKTEKVVAEPKKKSEDADTASAADALARAQLEASLK